VIQSILPLHEFGDPAATKPPHSVANSAAEPLQSVADSAAPGAAPTDFFDYIT
jgi:hypothetical protein